MKILNKK
jgi:serine/threonine protein kinase